MPHPGSTPLRFWTLQFFFFFFFLRRRLRPQYFYNIFITNYRWLVVISSNWLQYFYNIFHNKLQMVSCYWFKFKSITEIIYDITFLFFYTLSNSHAISAKSIWSGSQKSVVLTSYHINLVNKSLIHVMHMQIMS